MQEGKVDITLEVCGEPWFEGGGFFCWSVSYICSFVLWARSRGDVRALRLRYSEEKVAREPIRTPR